MDNKAANSQGTAAPAPADRSEIKEMIKQVVSKEKSLKTKEEKIDMAKVMVQIFEKKKIPYEALGITEEEIAAIYFYGFKIFNAGQTKEALEIFKILFKLKPSSDYAVALGACHHKLKDYKNAVSMYMAAVHINPMDPVPFFYCYDCFVNMGNLYGAKIAISNALINAKQNEKYKKIGEKAELLLKGLEEKIKKDLEKNGEKK